MRTLGAAALTLLAFGSAGCSERVEPTEEARAITIVQGSAPQASAARYVQQNLVSSPTLPDTPVLVSATSDRPLTLVTDEQGIMVSMDKATDPYHLRDIVMDDVS